MSDRTITVDLTILPHIQQDQVEWLVACALVDNGIPINPMDWRLTHGVLSCVENGAKRQYTWSGQDRRI
jgi:hypothetical protein